MSNDDSFDEEQESGRNPLRDRMKVLEQENAQLKAQAEEASSAARELAFVKAGVDPALPVSKYFMKGYEGELSPEAIREAAVEAQIIRDSSADQMKQESGAWTRSSQVAAGADSVVEEDWSTRISNAKSAEEVMTLLRQAQSQAQ